MKGGDFSLPFGVVPPALRGASETTDEEPDEEPGASPLSSVVIRTGVPKALAGAAGTVQKLPCRGAAAFAFTVLADLVLLSEKPS